MSVNYKSMTVSELKLICKQQQIKGYSKMKKNDIIALLSESGYEKYEKYEKILTDVKSNDEYKIYHDDCNKILEDIDEGSIDMIFSSPPYNIGKSYEKKSTIDDYILFMTEIIKKLYKVLKETGNICWQTGNHVNNGVIQPLDLLFHDIFIKAGFYFQKRIIWTFGHGLHCQNRFSGRYESICWYSKTKTHIINNLNNNVIINMWEKGIVEIPNVKSNHVEKTNHPCQFPVELVDRFILSLTEENHIVLDPFCGSGSTLISALMNRRKCIGIELYKEYIEIINDRINNFYNKTLRVRDMGKDIYDPSHSGNLSRKPKIWNDIKNTSLDYETNFDINNKCNEEDVLIVIYRNEEQLNILYEKENINSLCFIIKSTQNVREESIIYEYIKLNYKNIYNLKNRIICKNMIILWFSKKDFYFDLDAVRVPSKYPGKKSKKGEYSGNPLGKNPSDIWLDKDDKDDEIYIRIIRSLCKVGHSVVIYGDFKLTKKIKDLKRNIIVNI